MTVRVIVELEVVELGVDDAGTPRLWLTSAPPAQVKEWINNSLSDCLFVRGVCNALPEDFSNDYPQDDHTWIRINDRLELEAGIPDPLMPGGERLRKKIDDRFGCCTVEVYTQCMFTSFPLEEEVLRKEHGPDCD